MICYLICFCIAWILYLPCPANTDNVVCFPEQTYEFNQRLLTEHNNYRRIHHVPNLKLDYNLINEATAWSRNLVLQHSNSHGDYGENLYLKSGDNPSFYMMQPVQQWYNGVNDYDYNDPEANSAKTGRFTQVVWKSTRQIGCGVCTDGITTLVTCRYKPPGNIVGQYEDNVLEPNSHRIPLYLTIIVAVIIGITGSGVTCILIIAFLIWFNVFGNTD